VEYPASHLRQLARSPRGDPPNHQGTDGPQDPGDDYAARAPHAGPEESGDCETGTGLQPGVEQLPEFKCYSSSDTSCINASLPYFSAYLGIRNVKGGSHHETDRDEIDVPAWPAYLEVQSEVEIDR